MKRLNVKESPILFKPEMVRAILDGRKTQTRRVVKHIPELGAPDNWCHLVRDRPIPFERSLGDFRAYCPYGTVGDRLWVREQFRQAYPKTAYSDGLAYRADKKASMGIDEYSDRHKWKPSIYMPRWASRLTLEITGIRVERVNEITEEDAKAEGIFSHNGLGVGHSGFRYSQSSLVYDSAKLAFFSLITTIHGQDCIGLNPWLWVITFKILEDNKKGKS